MSTARNFFSPEEQKTILQAIESAEKRTSGEIRLHLEDFCAGDPVQVAARIFTSLGMHKTAERNGVLIYLATVSHKIAIIGDKGIHEKLGTEFWEHLVEKMIQEFKARHKLEALLGSIKEIGEQLGKFFPLKDDDKNELSNDISFSK